MNLFGEHSHKKWKIVSFFPVSLQLRKKGQVCTPITSISKQLNGVAFSILNSRRPYHLDDFTGVESAPTNVGFWKEMLGFSTSL